MKLKRSALIISLILLSSGLTTFGQEKRIRMKDLPPAVRSTVEQQSKGLKLRGLSKEIDRGKTVYEAELSVDGRTRDITMNSDGKIITVEEEVSLDSLPPAVLSTLRQQAGKIEFVESVTENGSLAYFEAHIRRGRQAVEIKVSPEGSVIR